MRHMRLGDMLVEAGVITNEQLQEALIGQKAKNMRLGEYLVSQKIITEQDLIEAMELQLGIEFVDLSKAGVDPVMAQIVPKSIARKNSVFPVRQDKDVLYLAMADPLNFMALEEVKTATRLKVVPMISTVSGIDRAIEALYGNVGAVKAIEEMSRDMIADEEAYQSFITSVIDKDASAAPTIRLVNSIMERAISERASDVHIEPRDEELVVRMRIDGQMRRILDVPKNLQNAIIARIKVMANLDISERRAPQDGRAAVRIKQVDVDLRVSSLPTIYGEKIVIRILRKDATLADCRGIGLVGADMEKYQRLIRNSSGIILIVGPTGSGKSSTMYVMVRDLNKENVNLVTLEDPVEYNMEGCNQVQINEKVGMTFAGGLRSILRQDPDIIAVGEIRDGETARIAMQSAITGHLVLSTIHTNDALSTIDRLLDIGVEPYMITSALKGIISQRLVRKICPNCRQEYKAKPEQLLALQLPTDADINFYEGRGCPHCFGSGYMGRTGVFEILILDAKLKYAISKKSSREELEVIAKAGGNFSPMIASLARLVQEGISSFEEAMRTISTTDV